MSLRSALRRIHDSSPVSAQTTMRLIYGRIPARWKLGREFSRYCQELLANEWRTRDDLDVMQLSKLQALVDHCYHQVPFYRKRFDAVGFRPVHLRAAADLRNIPPLTRDDLRNHFAEMRAANAARYRPELCFTGGSTGQPVKFLLDQKAITLEKACVRRHWLRSGYKDREPFANLRGLRLATKPPEYWINDKGENCLYLSSYELTPDTIESYVRTFNEFRPVLLNAYASSASLFASLIARRNLEIHSPRSIVCASETLYPHQRKLLESVFNTKVWDWYGLTELVGNASECDRHDGYHLSMEQGHFEVIREDGSNAEMGESGEIVATGLHNFSMPLLRYRTGDLGELDDTPCRCGRGSRMIRSITGRASEYIETPGGVRLTATALNVHDDTWNNVIQFQYVQERSDLVLLRVVTADTYSETDEKRILSRMGARFGDAIRLRMDYVSKIPKTPRGKSPLIVRETGT